MKTPEERLEAVIAALEQEKERAEYSLKRIDAILEKPFGTCCINTAFKEAKGGEEARIMKATELLQIAKGENT